MIKAKTWIGLWTSGFIVVALGCNREPIVEYGAGTGSDGALLPPRLGSAKLALSVGDVKIDTVTARLSCGSDFEPQTHTIDVRGRDAIVSIFFGDLPAGHGYEVELTGGDCSGSASFDVEAGETTPVNVDMTCGQADSEPAPATGSADLRASFVNAPHEALDAPACSHVTNIVAAPYIQQANGPLPIIELVLNDGVDATQIHWSSSSKNGATGVIGSVSGPADLAVTFDCITNGIADVVADITSVADDGECREEARALVDCRTQP